MQQRGREGAREGRLFVSNFHLNKKKQERANAGARPHTNYLICSYTIIFIDIIIVIISGGSNIVRTIVVIIRPVVIQQQQE